MNPRMNRRHAIKLISGTGLAIYLAPNFELPALASFESTLSDISPINRSLPEIAPPMWFSDYPDTAHKILWDKPAFLTKLGAKSPKPTERVPLVIIGGGIAGLFSAYILRKHKPIILEQAPRFGGNAKGQSTLLTIRHEVTSHFNTITLAYLVTDFSAKEPDPPECPVREASPSSRSWSWSGSSRSRLRLPCRTSRGTCGRAGSEPPRTWFPEPFKKPAPWPSCGTRRWGSHSSFRATRFSCS